MIFLYLQGGDPSRAIVPLAVRVEGGGHSGYLMVDSPGFVPFVTKRNIIITQAKHSSISSFKNILEPRLNFPSFLPSLKSSETHSLHTGSRTPERRPSVFSVRQTHPLKYHI